MPLDLNQCDKICHECVKAYIKKHKLKKGDAFEVLGCQGIPKEYIPPDILSSLGEDPETVQSMLDPVTWARKWLDWHCFDPEGKEWLRKYEEGTLGGLPKYDEARAKNGKSIFHRPYQLAMLRCSSTRKVFRIGRQCLTENTFITLADKTVEKIIDILPQENIQSLSLPSHKIENDIVVDVWPTGIRSVFVIKTEYGKEIECTSDHPLWTLSKKNSCFNDFYYSWKTIGSGLKIGDKLATKKPFKTISQLELQNDYFKQDIFWDPISSIEHLGPKQTYDIETVKNHNFFANGIVAHNCGKTETLCISILFHIFTHENFHVEIIAPYQAQIDLIFKRLMELINSNQVLANSVARSVKAPQYTIELKNGSMAIGFTAGTRSKQEAGASRGQHANMLVFDEADYLSSQDIDAALAVIINYPDATVWMSSTPTGRREKFYDSCFNKQNKEFHFPSTANPNWTSELEEYFRSELTSDGYDHEILAIFGEQEEGVYQLKYVEAAQSDYKYKDIAPNSSWTYMIGVDWNDFKIGTTIAVVGHNHQDNILYLVDKYIIARAERTQLAACQKIAEINRLWNASYIYVDQGYGSTQIEVLHDYGGRCLSTYGPNHPDSRLRNIVKGYDSGSNIDIRDLFTKQIVKKPAKPFMVENSVRRFESLQFKYPKSDENFTAQLLGYIVDRVSVTGRPVYRAQNETVGDHFLDAVNLALVAFVLEKSSLGKVNYVPQIAIAGRFGDPEGAKLTNKISYQNTAIEHRPKLGRSANIGENDKIFPSPNGEVPGNNMSQDGSTKLWSWDGFLNDGPRPQVRSLRQATRQAEYKLMGKRRTHKPTRKKF